MTRSSTSTVSDGNDNVARTSTDTTPNIATPADCRQCVTLKQKLQKLQTQLALKTRLFVELQKKHKAALRKIRTVSKNKVSFDCAISKFLNRDQQNALCRPSRRVNKWSPLTIKNALQIHFSCGPTGYTMLLDQKYPLPSLRTLRRSLQFVRFESGILSEVFQFLEIKVRQMSVQERECCLTLDEMSVTPSVDFDNKSGHFVGDVTLPGHTGVATHSLVFMVGGITTRWKQTVAYFYTGNSTDGAVFAPIIIDIIKRCNVIGLNVAAVTSDMGSANRAMWKKLGILGGKRAVTINSFPHPVNPHIKICVLADVPHVIKNVRNHLVNGQTITLPMNVVQKFNLPCNTVTIEPLKKLVEYQQDKDLKPAPNLTAKHLDPSHFDKMKVSHALNIFSHSVSAALKLMVETRQWDPHILTTCWFLDVMNRWFDLMSSRHPIIALSKFDIEKYNSAISFLDSVVDIFDGIAIGQTGAWKPVQTGVILSTLSVIQLQDRLLNCDNFKFLLTSRLTQDCLENLFSCVRRRNAVPTPLEFQKNLRLITVSQYLKGAETGSYDLDDGFLAADFVVDVDSSPDDSVSDELFNSCKSLVDHCSVRTVELDVTELCCLYYFAGYVVSRVVKNDKHCDLCIASIKADDLTQDLEPEITRLVTLKDYRPGSLVPCNQTSFNLFLSAEIAFRQCESSFLNASNDLREQLLNEILSRSVEVHLPECHGIKQKLIRRFIGARLQFFAKKMRVVRKEKVAKKTCHEMSSKSMQMRKSVSKIK